MWVVNMYHCETNVKTLEAIIAARTLIAYCKDHANSCEDCPFYIRNDEWINCMFEGDIPEGWEIRKYD